jgi:PPOX class probable FMN-dependent enzyme
VAVIETIEDLEAIYGAVPPQAKVKEVPYVAPLHREYIDASPFVLVATAGAEGLDCSPRGDPAGFVRVADDGRTMWMPDRRGNNRLDTLRNIVEDGRIALLFLVPGIGITLRVNGTAVLTTDDDLRATFAMDGKLPATVIEITPVTVYTQCPKALIRSSLWDPSRHRSPDELPTPGQILEWITNGDFDGAEYDAAYPERIKQTIY